MKNLFSKLIMPMFALLLFSACEDIPSPYYVLAPGEIQIELEGEGTKDSPFTVNDALMMINADEIPAGNVYVRGIIVSIDEIGGQYHNATYYICDKSAIDENGSASYRLEVYRGKGLGGEDLDAGDLEEGDEVIVFGKLVMYNSTPEFTQGSVLYYLNGTIVETESKSEPSGEGTYDNPWNVAAAQKIIASGPPSDKVYVHGIVSKINEIGGQYGNATYFISDDGSSAGQLEVYRGFGLDGAEFTGNGDLEIGDVVTVYGVLVLYGGNTPEFTQGSILVEHNEQKIPEPTPDQPGVPSGNGTLEDPYNAAGANALAETLTSGAKSENVYIKGKVSYIKENYDGGHGNGTFYISEDGKRSGEFYIYRAKYLGNTDWTEGNEVVNVGDDVIIYGKVTKYTSSYGTTLETQQYEAYLFELNGKRGDTNMGEPTGSGTLEDPYNSIAAIQICQQLGSNQNSDPVYVKGKVVSIKENYNGGHGNGTFYISDDGTTKGQFYIFRALYLGNVEYTEGTLPQKGDDVVIYGKLTNYQGNTPETVQKEAYLYSLNGETGSGQQGNPEATEGEGDGSYDNPYNVLAAMSYYKNSNGTPKNAFVKGYIVGFVNGNKMDESTCEYGYPNSVQTEILIADSPLETPDMYTKCIPVQLKKDSDFQSMLDLYSNQVALGAEVCLYGSIEKYFGVCGIKSLQWASLQAPSGDVWETGQFPANNIKKKRR